jgi:hypothetical protein
MCAVILDDPEERSKISGCLGIQLDETTDFCYIPSFFIRMVFDDGNAEDKLLQAVWLYVKTTSEGILQSTYANLQGNERFQ